MVRIGLRFILILGFSVTCDLQPVKHTCFVSDLFRKRELQTSLEQTTELVEPSIRTFSIPSGPTLSQPLPNRLMQGPRRPQGLDSTKKTVTEGRPSHSTVRPSLVNKKFITRLKIFGKKPRSRTGNHCKLQSAILIGCRLG